ncbi:hypothetical protein [Symbioplanes lichenis]|uniref:hypothetical protein n=1 Tax=Symbioplanes lichenis TaxID=1629072 RepID=UPI00273979C4|nr:hypothetical protein [Actinoplanes lichenis]
MRSRRVTVAVAAGHVLVEGGEDVVLVTQAGAVEPGHGDRAGGERGDDLVEG